MVRLNGKAARRADRTRAGCAPPCVRDRASRLPPRRAASLQRARRHRGRADRRGAAGVAAGPAVVVKHGETVTIDGVRNIVMRADQAKGGILLLTGGDGRLNVTDGAQFTDGADNVLIRNRDAFAARGCNVMLVDLGTDLAAAVGYMSRLKAPVTVIGTSKGTERLAQDWRRARVRTRWCCPRAFSARNPAGRQRASHPGHAVAAAAGRLSTTARTIAAGRARPGSSRSRPGPVRRSRSRGSTAAWTIRRIPAATAGTIASPAWTRHSWTASWPLSRSR